MSDYDDNIDDRKPSRPMLKPDDNVSIYSADIESDMRHVDYVLVYRPDDLDLATLRDMFESCMATENLVVTRERSGKFEFLKIYCPFERLCMEAERVRLEMPLKGCEIPPRNPRCFGFISRYLTTDNEVDFVSAPFENDKRHLYEGSDNTRTFFRTATRNFLVYNILINITINDKLIGHEEITEDNDNDASLKKRGLWYLRMKNAYVDDFALHDPSALDRYFENLRIESPDEFEKEKVKWIGDARRDLNDTWTKIMKFQPLWKIRNYFGEKIALYFAWIGVFVSVLWVPSIVGVVVFVYGLVNGVDNLDYPQPNCTALLNQTTLTTTPIPPLCRNGGSGTNLAKGWSDDVLGVIRASFDNIFSAFFALAICGWGVLFLAIWKRTRYTLAYEWDCDTFESAEPDRPQFFGTQQEEDPITGELSWVYPQWRKARKFTVSAIVVSMAVGIVFLSVTSVILLKVTMRVQFNCTNKYAVNEELLDFKGNTFICLITSAVLPSTLNALSIMLLGRLYTKVAHKLTEWVSENHRSQTQYNNSVIIKLFAFQFANTYASLFYIAFFRPEEHGFQNGGVFGLGDDYKDTCVRGECMSLLSFQVLVLMLLKPLPKFWMDIIWPWLFGFYKMFKLRKHKVSHLNRGSAHSMAELDDNGLNRKCSVDSASDHVRSSIERNYLKPTTGDFTLGEYTEKVIQFGYIMMFASSFPLAPLLALLINMVDIRIDAKRLLWWNRRPVAFLTTDIGMWLHILEFICYCGVVSNAFIVAYTSNFCNEFFDHQCSTEKRLLLVILFEHICIVLMYLIKAAVPHTPASVKLAQRRERYQVTKILEEGQVPHNRRRSAQAPTTGSTSCPDSGNGGSLERDRDSAEVRAPNGPMHAPNAVAKRKHKSKKRIEKKKRRIYDYDDYESRVARHNREYRRAKRRAGRNSHYSYDTGTNYSSRNRSRDTDFTIDRNYRDRDFSADTDYRHRQPETHRERRRY